MVLVKKRAFLKIVLKIFLTFSARVSSSHEKHMDFVYMDEGFCCCFSPQVYKLSWNKQGPDSNKIIPFGAGQGLTVNSILEREKDFSLQDKQRNCERFCPTLTRTRMLLIQHTHVDISCIHYIFGCSHIIRMSGDS